MWCHEANLRTERPDQGPGWVEVHETVGKGLAEGEQDGATEVAVRALREIRELRGQQGAEAVRLAKSALLAMGEK